MNKEHIIDDLDSAEVILYNILNGGEIDEEVFELVHSAVSDINTAKEVLNGPER